MTCLASRDAVQPASFGCRPCMLARLILGLLSLEDTFCAILSAGAVLYMASGP